MNRMKLFILSLLVFSYFNVFSQTTTLNFDFAPGVNDLDLSSLIGFSSVELETFNSNLLLIGSISSPLEQVVVNGYFNWESPQGTPSGQAFSFQSKPIDINGMLNFTNQDVGKNKTIEIESSSSDDNLLKEITKKGKLSGYNELTMWLTDVEGEVITSSITRTLTIANEVPNFSIITPTSELPVQQTGFQVQWSNSITTAEGFIVVINSNTFDSYDDAISGDINMNKEFPNVNDNLTLINLNSGDFSEGLSSGATYYLGVFAKVPNFGTYEYFPADNSGMQITVQSASSGAPETFSSTLDKTFDTSGSNLPPNAPSFSIQLPSLGAEFSIVYESPALNVEWAPVSDATNYTVVLKYLGSDDALIQNARSDNDKTAILGIDWVASTTTQTNLTLSNFPAPNGFVVNNNDYVVLGVIAEHPSFGNIRNKELRFGKILKTESGQFTVVEESVDAQALLDSGVDLSGSTGVDEDGNTLSGNEIENILRQISTGEIQGRITIINN